MIVAYDDASSASRIEYSLNPRRNRLLVPSTLSGKRSKYSEAEGFEKSYRKKKKKRITRLVVRRNVRAKVLVAWCRMVKRVPSGAGRQDQRGCKRV